MYKFIVFIFFVFCSGWSAHAQIKPKPRIEPKEGTISGRQLNDTLLNGKFKEESLIKLSEKTHYTDYKIISYRKDSTIVDTTLSLKKERLFNHLRKDIFELQSLHNLGETYNHLGYDFNEVHLLPKTGIRAKHQDFLEVKDVKYYRVPTPTTELFFKTGIQQGQVLNSVLTTNLSPELNLSIAYKGLRSLGDYRSALASHQNFRTTISFQDKKGRYKARTHFVSHNLMNQENAGLTPESINLFLTNAPGFTDRERLEVNAQGAESVLKTKRFYLEQTYDLWQHKDTTHRLSNTTLQFGHEFVYKKKYYNFTQDRASSNFGVAYQNSVLDSTYHKEMQNAVFANLTSPYVLGNIGFKATLSNYNYGYRSALFLESGSIAPYLKDDMLTTEAHWKAQFKTFALQTAVGSVLKGKLKGNYLQGTASYQQDSLFTLKASLLVKSEAPNLNMLLYQSTYKDYNWQNDFDNENTQSLQFHLNANKYGDYSVSSTLKEDYTYFDNNSKPTQYAEVLNYLKIEAHKKWKYRKFALDNRVLYQKVTHGAEVLHVPEILTENSLYFTDYVFKGDPLYMQTGITVKYYTKYEADEFNPLLNEYYIQSDVKLGNYPYLDVFFNGQLRRTRLFFKAENIFSFFNYNYLATPTQPYRDFTVRFGVVWDFFI